MMEKQIFALVAGITKSHQVSEKTVSELEEIKNFSHRGFPSKIRWDWISSDWDGTESVEGISTYLFVVTIICGSAIILALFVALCICLCLACTKSDSEDSKEGYQQIAS